MGTYARTRITARVNTQAKTAILEVMKKYKAEDCWNKYCKATKWGPDGLMQELGKRFHLIMFRVDVFGGDMSYTEYYFKGKVISNSDLTLFFPSKAGFDRAYKTQLDRNAARKKACILEEEKRKAAEIINLEDRLSNLKRSA